MSMIGVRAFLGDEGHWGKQSMEAWVVLDKFDINTSALLISSAV